MKLHSLTVMVELHQLLFDVVEDGSRLNEMASLPQRHVHVVTAATPCKQLSAVGPFL